MEMNEENYKERDTKRIVDYIRRFAPEDVAVEEVIRYSGAEKLRVYPALFDLEQQQLIAVTEREELGAAKRVKWI